MDYTHEYFVLLPPEVDSCTGGELGSITECASNVYCAYHSSYPVPKSTQELIYAVDPYMNGFSGCDDSNHPNGTGDSALQTLSHEHAESITTPS